MVVDVLTLGAGKALQGMLISSRIQDVEKDLASRVAVDAHGRQSHVEDVIAHRLRLRLFSAINALVEEDTIAAGDVHGVFTITVLQISVS